MDFKKMNQIANNAFMSIQQDRMLEEYNLAKSNPNKYRLSSLIPNGKLNYYWYHTLVKYNPKDKRKLLERHSWCRSKHKNVAGYFLVWYEIYKDNRTKRTNWKAEKTRKDAEDFCRKMETSKRVLKKDEIEENFNQTF